MQLISVLTVALGAVTIAQAGSSRRAPKRTRDGWDQISSSSSDDDGGLNKRETNTASMAFDAFMKTFGDALRGIQ